MPVRSVVKQKFQNEGLLLCCFFGYIIPRVSFERSGYNCWDSVNICFAFLITKRVNITAQGLADIGTLAGDFGLAYVSGIEPIQIPPANKSGLIFSFQFYDMQASQISWTNFQLGAPNNELAIVL